MRGGEQPLGTAGGISENRRVFRPFPRFAVQHLLDLSHEQLTAWLVERQLPAYRAGQIRHWIFEKLPARSRP